MSLSPEDRKIEFSTRVSPEIQMEVLTKPASELSSGARQALSDLGLVGAFNAQED